MNLFIIRHGETEENKMGIVQGRGVDSQLNKTGLAQANFFYENYKEENFEIVISSSLKRSIQTVESFIKEGIPWIAEPDIDEIDWGTHEGQKYNPLLIANYNELISRWNDGKLDHSLPNGESAEDLVNRLDRFIEKLKQRSEKKILICTHGRTIRCLLCRLLGLNLSEMEEFRHANTGVFQLSFDGNSFHLEVNNDVSHLPNHLMPGNHHVKG